MKNTSIKINQLNKNDQIKIVEGPDVNATHSRISLFWYIK